MMVLSHIAATFVAALAGFGWLSLLRWPGVADRSLYERAGLAYLVGIATIAFEILLFGFIRIPANLWTLLLFQLIPVALLAWRARRIGIDFIARLNASPSSWWRLRWWQWALIILIASKLIYVFTMNLTELRRTDDAFAYWLSAAKHTYYEQSHTSFTMGRNYPKPPGLVLDWFALWRGRWDEFAINLAYFNYFAALILLFYGNLRTRIGKSAALMSVYVLTTFPILLNHAVMIGYADLPLAIALCFAGVYAWRYARDGARDHLALALFFACCLPFIKTEGKVPYFLFALYAIILAEGRRRGLLTPKRAWLLTGALAALGVLAIGAMTLIYGDHEPGFLPPRLWYRIRPGYHLDEIATPLLGHFGWRFNNWMLVGPLCALALPFLTAWRWRKAEMIIGLYALLALLSYLYLFCVGGAYEFLVNGTTVNRSFLQIIPTILFATTVMLSKERDDMKREPAASQ